jgi:hypothetical protein
MKHSVICRVLRVFAVVGMACGLTASSWADYITLPVKWSQPITTNGVAVTGPGPFADTIDLFDVSSDHTANIVRADDFTSNGRPIVAVRWWGSYIGEPQRTNGYTGPFDISFHLSDGTAHPFSKPVSTPLVIYTPITAQEVFVGVDTAGDSVYRYDAYLTTPFNEQAGVEYFIDIDKPTGEGWGWHMTTLQKQDFSAVAPTHTGPWFNENFDLAFELMWVPEPSTGLLLLLGGAASLGRRRRRVSLS